MEHYVITISRKFGCLGHEIAGRLGELLGVPVYDRSAVEAQVLSTGAEARLLAATQLEEGRKKTQFLLFRKEADGEKDLRARVMFQAQSEVLKSFVEKSAGQGSPSELCQDAAHGRGSGKSFDSQGRQSQGRLQTPVLQPCFRCNLWPPSPDGFESVRGGGERSDTGTGGALSVQPSRRESGGQFA